MTGPLPQQGDERSIEPVEGLLDGATYWVVGSGDRAPRLVAGWEDAHPFCAAVTTTSVGLAFCRRCPLPVVGRVFQTGRAARVPCQAGIPLLAFPAPRRSRRSVAVLRCGGPDRRRIREVAATVHVDPRALRNAARLASRPDGRSILTAARELRRADGLLAWQVRLRDRASERRRMASAAIAQLLATTEELIDHSRLAERQRRRLVRAERRLDRLARELVETRAAERAAVAHRIHDTVAQSLVSAHRFLQAALVSTPLPEPAPGHLDEVTARLSTAISELRAILEGLAPPALEELGLRRAIEQRLRSLARDDTVIWSIDGDVPRLPAAVEQALFGMIAEAASNVVRHAGARRGQIRLGLARGRVVVVVEDDGHGFDVPATSKDPHRGLGLEGLRRQAAWLGGRAEVWSSIGAGTRVRISIPLPASTAAHGSSGTR